MKKLLFILIFILFSANLMAYNHVELESADLPYTASNNDSITFATSLLTTTGSGINCSTKDTVFINLDTDTLIFGTGASAGAYGINLAGSSGNPTTAIKIRGGLIMNDSTTYPVGQNCIAFDAVYGHNFNIDSVSCKIWGDGGHCISGLGTLVPGFYDVTIRGGHYWNNCDEYTSRCSYDGAAIHIEQRFALTDSSELNYNIKVVDVTIHQSPGQGIAVAGKVPVFPDYPDFGKPTIIVDSCNITCDVKNDKYTYPTGYPCLGAGNGYGVLLSYCGDSSKVRWNTIQSGSERWGSRGVALENCDGGWSGDEELYVECAYNIIDVHEGPEPYGGEDNPSHGIRIRPLDNQVSQNIWVHHNNITVTGNSTTGYDGYSNYCYGIRSSIAKEWFVGNDTCAKYIIENNHVVMLTDGTPGAIPELSAFAFDYHRAYSGDTTIKVRYNYFESQGWCVSYGSISYDYGDYGRLYQDTLNLVDCIPSSDTAAIYFDNKASSSSPGCEVWDCVWLNSATDLNGVPTTVATYDVTYFEQARFAIIGSNDSLVSQVDLFLYNDYGQLVGTFSTGDSGIGSIKVEYQYLESGASDSLWSGFNDFYVKAINSLGTDSVDNYITITGGFEIDTLVLSNTLGDIGGELSNVASVGTIDINDIDVICTHLNFTNVDTIYAFYDLDNNIAGADSVSVTTSLTSPKTINASGLTQNTLYWFWTVVCSDEGRDTSSVVSATTLEESSEAEGIRLNKQINSRGNIKYR